MYLYQQHQIQQAVLLMVPKRFNIFGCYFEQASKFIVSAGTTNID